MKNFYAMRVSEGGANWSASKLATVSYSYSMYVSFVLASVIVSAMLETVTYGIPQGTFTIHEQVSLSVSPVALSVIVSVEDSRVTFLSPQFEGFYEQALIAKSAEAKSCEEGVVSSGMSS